MKNLLEKIVIAVLICILGCMLYNNYISKHDPIEPIEPIITEKVITIREIAEDTVWVEKIKTIAVPCKGDTVYVEIPIEGKIYTDTVYIDKNSYKVDVGLTGYEASLDSITFTPLIVAQKSKWSLGVQGGVGVGCSGFTPYIGVGVQYKLFEW